MWPESEVVYAYQVLDLYHQGFVWPKYHFWLFPITIVIISIIFSPCFKLVKTYHHAKFQKNILTGLARMMVQTYRWTDRHLIIHIYILPSQCQHENFQMPLKFQPGWQWVWLITNYTYSHTYMWLIMLPCFLDSIWQISA